MLNGFQLLNNMKRLYNVSCLAKTARKLKNKWLLLNGQAEKPQQQVSGSITYSQCGEDAIVEYIFRLRGVDKILYLDAGAFDPLYLSNTALFYFRGSSGVVVDPNPVTAKRFKQIRPKDIVCQIAINSSSESLSYYEFSDPTLNTSSIQEMRELILLGKDLINTSKIKSMMIDDIIKTYLNGHCPDFLSLDIEGMDLEIIKSLNFELYRPKVICMETVKYSPIGQGEKNDDSVVFMKSQGYIEYAFTGLNSIFVDSGFWA